MCVRAGDMQWGSVPRERVLPFELWELREVAVRRTALDASSLIARGDFSGPVLAAGRHAKRGSFAPFDRVRPRWYGAPALPRGGAV